MTPRDREIVRAALALREALKGLFGPDDRGDFALAKRVEEILQAAADSCPIEPTREVFRKVGLAVLLFDDALAAPREADAPFDLDAALQAVGFTREARYDGWTDGTFRCRFVPRIDFGILAGFDRWANSVDFYALAPNNQVDFDRMIARLRHHHAAGNYDLNDAKELRID